ncbi:hypothetical protein BD626DRAFT_635241 [Schizophyllum amplum]|uniref:3'-5' exonuclease domain-containing protein n=1 Tax=Schizophyllum amplum TaxID=97359 RepID=A0A550BWJ0_9AGAR|nr:hypothetical protein BD626DRAFT_635241 [Auriculariopsis ampla]
MALDQLALNSTRLAAALPSDIAFHRTIDDDLGDDLDDVSDRVHTLLARLLALARPAAPADPADFKQVVDTVDWLLEGADDTLDVLTGKKKLPQIAVAPAPVPTRVMPNPHPDNRDVPFAYDDRTHPCKSSLTRLVLPAHALQPQEPVHPKHTASTAPNIAPLPTDPPSFHNVSVDMITTPDALDALLTRLRNYASLPDRELLLAIDLEHHSAHSYRGFVCLMQLTVRVRALRNDTPTEQADYLVDALVLRNYLTALNEFTTNANIIKIFHGAASDIPWLAENFNVHVVGMFDTYHAARALGALAAAEGKPPPPLSLGHLLKTYCDYDADKRLARSDWRVRPLPPPLLSYARSDTHFLPFIYDVVKGLLADAPPTLAADPHGEDGGGTAIEVLVESGDGAVDGGEEAQEGGREEAPEGALRQAPEGALRQIFEASARTCLRAPRWLTGATLPHAARALARRMNRPVLGEEGSLDHAVFLALYRWRDGAARGADEGVGTILPNSALLIIADRWRALITGLDGASRETLASTAGFTPIAGFTPTTGSLTAPTASGASSSAVSGTSDVTSTTSTAGQPTLTPLAAAAPHAALASLVAPASLPGPARVRAGEIVRVVEGAVRGWVPVTWTRLNGVAAAEVEVVNAAATKQGTLTALATMQAAALATTRAAAAGSATGGMTPTSGDNAMKDDDAMKDDGATAEASGPAPSVAASALFGGASAPAATTSALFGGAPAKGKSSLFGAGLAKAQSASSGGVLGKVQSSLFGTGPAKAQSSMFGGAPAKAQSSLFGGVLGKKSEVAASVVSDAAARTRESALGAATSASGATMSTLFGGTLRRNAASDSTLKNSTGVPFASKDASSTSAGASSTSVDPSSAFRTGPSLAAIAARVHASFGLGPIGVPTPFNSQDVKAGAFNAGSTVTPNPAATAEHAFVPAGQRSGQSRGTANSRAFTSTRKTVTGLTDADRNAFAVLEMESAEMEGVEGEDALEPRGDMNGQGEESRSRKPTKASLPSQAAPTIMDDALVAGAGAGRRKRKRTKGPAADLSATVDSTPSVGATASAVGGSTSSSTVADSATVTFDFASVPNILDAQAPPAVGAGDKPKKKKRKTGEGEKGPHFRAPAPAPAEVRGVKVNMAHTFK